MFWISVCLCKPTGFWHILTLRISPCFRSAFLASGSPSESESWPSNNLASRSPETRWIEPWWKIEQLPRSEIQFLEGIPFFWGLILLSHTGKMMKNADIWSQNYWAMVDSWNTTTCLAFGLTMGESPIFSTMWNMVKSTHVFKWETYKQALKINIHKSTITYINSIYHINDGLYV